MSLSMHGLTVGYGKKAVVKNVDLDIREGKITALLGSNGCGKSTLLKAMARILAPSSGEVHWRGKNLRHLPSRVLAREIALLPQTQPLPEGIKVEELVAYGRSPYTGFWGRKDKEDNQIIYDVMVELGISDLSEHLLSELSGGQRQRVWLAMTLAQDTPYLLLDEPTTYMDLNHQVELMKILRKLNLGGKTIIIVLHDINQAARYCDHLIVMKEGEIVIQGEPDIVLTRQMLKTAFSLDAQIHQDPIAQTPMCIVN